MNTATVRQRRLDEPRSHEVYYRGEPVEAGLTRDEARRKQRALQRRERKFAYRR